MNSGFDQAHAMVHQSYEALTGITTDINHPLCDFCYIKHWRHGSKVIPKEKCVDRITKISAQMAQLMTDLAPDLHQEQHDPGDLMHQQLHSMLQPISSVKLLNGVVHPMCRFCHMLHWGMSPNPVADRHVAMEELAKLTRELFYVQGM